VNEFGDYLRALRGDKSIREVARAIGVSHTYLTTLEKGYDPRTKKPRKPNPNVLNKLASYYNIPNGELALKAGYEQFEYDDIKNKKRPKPITFKRVGDQTGTTIHANHIDFDDLLDLLSIDKELYFNGKRLTVDEKKKILSLIKTLLS
jgi:transcriptional regulator with XRE-family HTH domain